MKKSVLLVLASTFALVSSGALALGPSASYSPESAQASEKTEPAAKPAPGNTAARAQLGAWGVETQYLKKDVNPGDDFYRYVDGGWIEAAKLPQGFPAMQSLTEVFLKTEKQIRGIVTDLNARQWPANSSEGQISAFYKSYMDEARLDQLGAAPIRPEIDAILKAGSHSDLSRLMGMDMFPQLVGLGVLLDPGNPERYVLTARAAGLGMPGSEFYLTEGEPFASIRTAYVAYIEEILGLAGIDNAKSRAAAVMAFETALARVNWSTTEKRDSVRRYHPMKMDEFLGYAPGIDWPAMIDAYGAAGQKEIVVDMDTAIRDSSALFAKTPVETLQSYLLFQLVNERAPLLSSGIDGANFRFFSGKLTGVKEQRARADRAIAMLNAAFGEPLGKIYVERYFPASSKAEVKRMVGYMQTALRARLRALPWMDDKTRAEAIAKLDSFGVKIGYPDKWRDYSSIDVRADDLLGNSRRISHWSRQDTLARLKAPKRPWEWEMQPQTVNAYYIAVRNEIVFAAAFLQPPFFDPNADPAVNFGSIAAVIGHEIGHGFDDQGSRSDNKGMIRDWWTPTSRTEFDRRGAALAAQYDQYSPVPGAMVNGKLTLGENIGDLGGITIAYDAWRRFADKEYGGKPPVIDGFTGDQRFFMGYAQLWRAKATDEYWRNQVLTDNHSPGEFRANGIVRNFDPWYKAFNVKPGDKLYLPPEKRVKIW